MLDFDGMFSSEEAKKLYKKTFLLNLFKKFCVRMEKNSNYKKRVLNLYRQSYNQEQTIAGLIEQEFNYKMSEDESKTMFLWVKANLLKSQTRKPISLEIKKELYQQQNGKCMGCGEDLGLDWSKIHVDHIIPFKLVGDELPNNYQDLCQICNESKSCSTDYLFRALLKLN